MKGTIPPHMFWTASLYVSVFEISAVVSERRARCHRIYLGLCCFACPFFVLFAVVSEEKEQFNRNSLKTNFCEVLMLAMIAVDYTDAAGFHRKNEKRKLYRCQTAAQYTSTRCQPDVKQM